MKKFNHKTDFFRFNVDLFSEYKVTISAVNWEIAHGNDTISNETTKSIYYRKPAFPDTSEFDIEYRRMINSDILAIIDGLTNSFDGVVLSKPYLLRRAENKVYQLVYAQKHSILMPESFVGNNNHWEHLSKPRIIKPLSVGKITTPSGISIIQTNLMHDEDSYDSIELTPVYIQNYVQKSYEVRVTVIDDNFFAVKIISDNSVDWRNGNNQYELIDIPEDIKECIQKMMKDFQLRFGAIDYIVGEDGKWYFLEINPNGQWQWLESILNLSISDCIMRVLIGGNT
jgi:glutathione synthase/RimK-type ligase-like ATP-grasp enzyme